MQADDFISNANVNCDYDVAVNVSIINIKLHIKWIQTTIYTIITMMMMIKGNKFEFFFFIPNNLVIHLHRHFYC